MEKKRNFFQKIWTSIRDFEKYEEFAADKVSSAIKYLALLTLIFTLIISAIYTYKFYTIVDGVKEYISKNIEEVKFEDGKLAVETKETIAVIDEENFIPIIIVDTAEDADIEAYKEKIKAYDNGIIMLSDRAIISSNLMSQDETIYYSNFIEQNIENKEELINLISESSMIYAYGIFCITIFVYLFIVYFTSNIIDGVVLGVLGYIFARIVKLRLRYKATFNIGLHALTLPIILNLIYIAVNTFTNFKINYFQWMYTSISYIYVAVAILMIKAEIINQRIQLTKLEEIQDNIKEEAIEEETQEKQKDKEEKKEDNKNKGQEEQPEGEF